MFIPYSFFSLHYPFLITLTSALIIGVCFGVMGVIALLRRQSLLGDTLAHAALPGIVLAIAYSGTTQPILVFLGGLLSCLSALAIFSTIQRFSPLKTDTVMGIILSVFFGFGLLLITLLQKWGINHQGSFNKFLFGNASTILPLDFYLICMSCSGCMLFFYFFKKEIIASTFDPLFMQSAGYSRWVIDHGIMFLLVMLIVVGLQTMGTILISSLLIMPATAAFQWSTRLQNIFKIAAFLGGCGCIMGSCVSRILDHMPTGPIIVMIMSFFVIIALVTSYKKAPL